MAEARTTITVDAAHPTHAVDPLLYGVFFEEINYAGCGGIYAEKIQNRAFMDPLTADAWGESVIDRCAGRFGRGLRLNDGTRNAKVALPEGIVGDLTECTIAAWINPTNVHPFAKVFDFGNGQTGIVYYNRAGAHMSLALASTQYLGGGSGPGPSFVISVDGAKEALNAPDPLPPGEWTHIAVTLHGGTGRLFVNGVVAAENTEMTLTPADMGPTVKNWIGASQFHVDPLFQGVIDEFHIYDRALGEAEVRSLMEAEGGSAGGGNVAWYRFEEDGGSTVADSSGAGHDAVIVEPESAWRPLADGGGSVRASLDDRAPLNDQLTRSLRLDIGGVDAGQRVGMANTGYFGVPAVAGETSRVSFWAKAATDLSVPVTVAIEKVDGSGTVAAASVSGLTSEWQRFETTLTVPDDAGDTTDNRFVIGIDRRDESAATSGDAALTDATIWLQVVSLFPPTYEGRENGFRADLVELLRALEPGFLRFPGGTYVLGRTVETRFDWKSAIGPIWERPGHDNDVWGYWSDDGLGLLEYLQLAEDLDAIPVVGVYPGLSGGRPVPQDELAPYVQDALDLIEYTIGPVTSTWARERAADGHPEPFATPIIEIGNEDFLGVGDSYTAYRYPMFHDAIKAAYPQVKTIATMPVPGHDVEILDEHMYRGPKALIERAEQYDDYDRDGVKIFVGEWAVVTDAGNHCTSTLDAAIAEACVHDGARAQRGRRRHAVLRTAVRVRRRVAVEPRPDRVRPPAQLRLTVVLGAAAVRDLSRGPVPPHGVDLGAAVLLGDRRHRDGLDVPQGREPDRRGRPRHGAVRRRRRQRGDRPRPDRGRSRRAQRVGGSGARGPAVVPTAGHGRNVRLRGPSAFGVGDRLLRGCAVRRRSGAMTVRSERHGDGRGGAPRASGDDGGVDVCVLVRGTRAMRGPSASWTASGERAPRHQERRRAATSTGARR